MLAHISSPHSTYAHATKPNCSSSIPDCLGSYAHSPHRRRVLRGQRINRHSARTTRGPMHQGSRFHSMNTQDQLQKNHHSTFPVNRIASRQPYLQEAESAHLNVEVSGQAVHKPGTVRFRSRTHKSGCRTKAGSASDTAAHQPPSPASRYQDRPWSSPLRAPHRVSIHPDFTSSPSAR